MEICNCWCTVSRCSAVAVCCSVLHCVALCCSWRVWSRCAPCRKSTLVGTVALGFGSVAVWLYKPDLANELGSFHLAKWSRS